MTSTPSSSSSISKQQIINKYFSSYCPVANVAEYFYILGIDSSAAFNEPLSNFKSTSLTPSLISQFPPFTRPYSPIDKSILITHCFPQGFKITSSPTPPDIEVFHFNLDNLLYMEDVPKLYFTVLIFYEPLSAYKELRKAFKRNLKFGIRESDTAVPCAIHAHSVPSHSQRSHSHYQRDITFSFRQKYPINNTTSIHYCKCKCNSHQQQQHQQQQHLLKRNKSSHKYKHNIDIDNSNDSSNTNANSSNEEYIPKALCISSRCPFPREFHKVLKVYYDYSQSSNIKYPLEKLIEVLTLNIPLPTPGVVTYKYNLPNNKSVSFSRTEINKRNIISYKMTTIFNFQDKDILDIYRLLLFEQPILFFSKDKALLTNVVNTFLELLFPFKYQYPNIAILPIINYGLIEIEECFCFGINEEYSDTFFDRYHLFFVNRNIQIADIDNGVLKDRPPQNDRIPMIKLKDLGEKQRDELKTISALSGDLHKSYKPKLTNKLATMRKTLTNGYTPLNERAAFRASCIDKDEDKDEREITDMLNNNDELTDTFLEYVSSVMMDYHKALHQSRCREMVDNILNSKKKTPISELFNIEAIDLHGDKVLADLSRTKLFYDFIERNYLLNTVDDRITFLFFKDITVFYKRRRNKNKKDLKLFCEDSAFKSKQSITFRLPRYFTKDELYFIKLQHTRNSPIMYFQHVTNKNIHYLLFPKLLYDNVFFPKRIVRPAKTLNVDLSIKLRLAEMFDEKREEFFVKYERAYVERFALTPVSKFSNNKIHDYAFMNMLYMFAMVFHYCEFNEKHFRFYEMLEVIGKLSYVDRATLSLLFASVVEHGTEFMAIKLYETIQEYGFIPKYSEYAYLCNKLACNNSHMKKNELQYSKITIIYYFKDQNNENKFYETTQENVNAIQRRTFNAGDNDLVLFDSDIMCSHCKKFVEATKYTLQYDKMDPSHQMAPCPFCNKQIVPTMTIRIGEDNSTETYEMCNPYYLFMFYIKDLIRDYRTTLDLDVLRYEHTKLFWNLLWYMYMTFSSFDILLKYKEAEIVNRPRRLESFMSSVSEIGGKGGIGSKMGLVPTVDKLSVQCKVVNFCYLSKSANNSNNNNNHHNTK